jgi:hypothetical protein
MDTRDWPVHYKPPWMFPARFLIPIVAVEVTHIQTKTEYGGTERKQNFCLGEKYKSTRKWRRRNNKNMCCILT